MKKTAFSDWWQVFRFTFMQGTIGRGFKLVTIGVALIMIGLSVVLNIFMAKSQKEDLEKSSIENVYIINNSGMDKIYYENLAEEYEGKYSEVTFTECDEDVASVSETIGNKGESVKDIILEIVSEEESFVAKVLLPSNTDISEDEALEFGEDILMTVEISKMLSMDIPMENKVLALSDVIVDKIVAGEIQESEDEQMMRIFAPLLLIMFLYFINLVYGQSMGNVVSIEKSSKLVEFMMTFTSPYCFLFGKISATASIAIGQLTIWLTSLVAGYGIGDVIARQFIFEDYNNELYMLIDLLKSQSGSTSFSVGAIILTVFTMCISVLFYCMLAAFVASFVSKADELASAMGVYQVIMIVGFLLSYGMPNDGAPNETMTMLKNVVPFVSAYSLPGDILVGNVDLHMGIVYSLILTASLVVLVYATGKVYKSQLFNKGKSGKFQTIINKLLRRSA